MGALNVNLSTDLIANTVSNTSNNGFNADNTAGFSSDYAKILQQKIAQVENQTANISANQIKIDNSRNSLTNIETIKRFRPDGTITITTYEDGKVTNLTKIKPHLVPTPDYSAPPTPEGHVAIKMEPHLSLMELMMV